MALRYYKTPHLSGRGVLFSGGLTLGLGKVGDSALVPKAGCTFVIHTQLRYKQRFRQSRVAHRRVL